MLLTVPASQGRVPSKQGLEKAGRPLHLEALRNSGPLSAELGTTSTKEEVKFIRHIKAEVTYDMTYRSGAKAANTDLGKSRTILPIPGFSKRVILVSG